MNISTDTATKAAPRYQTYLQAYKALQMGTERITHAQEEDIDTLPDDLAEARLAYAACRERLEAIRAQLNGFADDIAS